MSKQLSPATRKIALLLFAVAALVAVVCIAAYFFTFAPLSDYRLPKNSASWANFGNYVAGILGPFFAFLAFVGVLFAVWFQAKQLDISREQANLEEIQRVLATVSSRIDGLLAQPPNVHIQHHRLRNAPVTIFTIIAAAGSAALSKPDGYIAEASREQFIAEAKHAMETESSDIGLELEQLAWCLQEYEKEMGSATVVEFYRRRYRSVACWLDSIELLNSHHRVQQFFEPKENRKYLQP